ncbi:hypothetical protein BVX97_01125 [bacterium E08(2017)]|nr:hypothetical protein BVX97_01125 [bacterium E08(2017)]
MKMNTKVILFFGVFLLLLATLFPCRKWSAESPIIEKAKGEFYPPRTFLYSNHVIHQRMIEIDMQRSILDWFAITFLTASAVMAVRLKEN